jgi:hypothetical protein
VNGRTHQGQAKADAFASSACHSRAPSPHPATGPAAALLSLQQAAGNAAVSDLLVGGAPLPPALRRDMEQRFGCDFSAVRIHDGPGAEAATKSLSAKAVTIGSHIAFDAGRFAPDTSDGRRLIAHELAHVVQQSRSGSAPPSIDGTGPLESEAARAGEAAAGGDGPVAVSGHGAVGPAADPEGDARNILQDVLKRLEFDLMDARIAADRQKQQLVAQGGQAQWNDKRASVTKPIYNIQERKAAIQAQQQVPKGQRVLYDVKVEAIEIGPSQGSLSKRTVNLRNKYGGVPRTFDNLVYATDSKGEVIGTQPIELKSEGAQTEKSLLARSVRGGVTQGDIEANFRPLSTIAKQTAKTVSLRQDAADLGGVLVLRGLDAETGQEIVLRVPPNALGEERITSYGRLSDVVGVPVTRPAPPGSGTIPGSTPTTDEGEGAHGGGAKVQVAPAKGGKVTVSTEGGEAAGGRSLRSPRVLNFAAGIAVHAGIALVDMWIQARLYKGRFQSALERLEPQIKTEVQKAGGQAARLQAAGKTVYANVTISVLESHTLSQGGGYTRGDIVDTAIPELTLRNVEFSEDNINTIGTRTIKSLETGPGQYGYRVPYTYSFPVSVTKEAAELLRKYDAEKDPAAKAGLRAEIIQMFGEDVEHNTLDADMWPHWDFITNSSALREGRDVWGFTSEQPAVVIRRVPRVEKLRLIRLLWAGHVHDEDITAIGVIWANSSPEAKAAIRAEIDPSDLSDDDNRAKLKEILKH